MTTVDYAARLELVSAAIDALVTRGMQEYQIDGQRVTKLNLPDLVAEEQRLQRLVARQTRSRGAFRTVVPR